MKTQLSQPQAGNRRLLMSEIVLSGDVRERGGVKRRNLLVVTARLEVTPLVPVLYTGSRSQSGVVTQFL